MIAALPMYDLPPLRAANDRLWAGIRDALRAAGRPAPDALSRGGDLWAQWRAPDLVLSQTCGLPYRAALHGRVTLIGTPDYGVGGCLPGHYRSVLVARRDHPGEGIAALASGRFAINDWLSQSGWGAPWAAARAAGIGLRPALVTGSHAGSVRALAEGRADTAAIDAVTWRHLRRWDPAAAALRELGLTAPTPGLPFIAAVGADAGALFAAVADGIAALAAADREILGLLGLVAIPAAGYLALPLPPGAAPP